MADGDPSSPSAGYPHSPQPQGSSDEPESPVTQSQSTSDVSHADAPEEGIDAPPVSPPVGEEQVVEEEVLEESVDQEESYQEATEDSTGGEAEKSRSPASSTGDANEESAPGAGDEEEVEEQSSSKKKRRLLASDDEDDGVEDGDAPQAESRNEEESSSPEKKRKIVMSSDEESGNEGEGDEEKKDLTRNLLGSDVSSDDEDDGDIEDKQEDVGELMANIFGDDSDEEGGGGGEGEGRADNDGEEDAQPESKRKYRDEDEGGFEWDFDVMLRKKKLEKKKKRRKRDGGIDIINDDDGSIQAMVEAMKQATKEDRHSNVERKPALQKRKLLPQVKSMLLRNELVEAMVENGMMSAVSDWLSPLPDKSLPALEIRSTLLQRLQDFARLEQSVLKQSGLGKAVMLLYKHPRETKQNKELASRLIREWSRPIFQIETDFRSISREERVQRDLEHMPQAKKRRLSSDAGPSTSKKEEVVLKPGDKGYIGRARVPRPSTKDYVVRPKHAVEGQFKGERKANKFERIDKTQRDFLERTKKLKVKRAVQVSLEGRNLAI